MSTTSYELSYGGDPNALALRQWLDNALAETAISPALDSSIDLMHEDVFINGLDARADLRRLPFTRLSKNYDGEQFQYEWTEFNPTVSKDNESIGDETVHRYHTRTFRFVDSILEEKQRHLKTKSSLKESWLPVDMVDVMNIREYFEYSDWERRPKLCLQTIVRRCGGYAAKLFNRRASVDERFPTVSL